MIGFTKLEAQLMTEKSGEQPTLNDDAQCGYLSEGKCSVYDVRPAICRLFGSTEKLPCIHGCEPDNGRIPETESMKILDEIDKLNGGDRKMYSNMTKLQAVNIRLGQPLSAPLSDLHVDGVSTIVPFKKKD